MAPQLRLIPAEGDGPQPLASFRTDARLRLWGAGLCACGAIAMTAIGYHRSLSPVLAGPVAEALLLWSLYLLATFAARRAVRYSLRAHRLEVERGVFGKRYESVDLWRVRDVVLEQTLLERLRGVGRITVLSTDQVEPELLVGPVPSAKSLYDILRDAVAAARKEARVVPLG